MRDKFEDWYLSSCLDVHEELPAWIAWKAALAQQTSAEKTLKMLGYTDCGGELWKPPLGTVEKSLLGSLSKNWTEDSGHENGNYTCKCGTCGCMFLGHKRRVTCKECAVVSDPAQVSQPVDSIRNYPEFVTDILRLSDASVSKDTKQQIRKSIYDTIDSRVANAAPKKYQELRREYEELNHLNYVLQSELLDSDTSLKSVEKSLDGLDYFGTYAEQIESLKLRVAELEDESRTKHECAMQMLGERDRLQSECDRLRDAAKQALLALHYHTEQTRPIDTSFGAMNALNAALMPAQKEKEK